MTKLKNLKFDKTQNSKCDNSKTQNVTKLLKKNEEEKNQNVTNSKIQIETKLIDLNCHTTYRLKW